MNMTEEVANRLADIVHWCNQRPRWQKALVIAVAAGGVGALGYYGWLMPGVSYICLLLKKAIRIVVSGCLLKLGMVIYDRFYDDFCTWLLRRLFGESENTTYTYEHRGYRYTIDVTPPDPENPSASRDLLEYEWELAGYRFVASMAPIPRRRPRRVHSD